MPKPKVFNLLLISLLSCSVSASNSEENGHMLLQDEFRNGTSIEFDEDQDEVYDAVKRGLIKPFSELYSAVDQQLNGRLIKVELDEDDDEWVYELKIIHEGNVIKVEYNATTLEVIEIKGRNLLNVIKK
ncbi:PepSY domain-containing protein [Vibrio sp. F74]|uniref:PepSY domain-containing protein n=1 Tax=Vibrio sp. F74 TaxID=700020 RepID=UPI0035F53739